MSIKTTVTQKKIFLRPVDAIILCVNDVLSLKEVLMNTPSGRKLSMVLSLTPKVRISEIGKRLHSDNRSELLQEKRTDMKLSFLERDNVG